MTFSLDVDGLAMALTALGPAFASKCWDYGCQLTMPDKLHILKSLHK